MPSEPKPQSHGQPPSGEIDTEFDLDDALFDAFPPNDEQEPLPETGDFWIEPHTPDET